MELATDLFRFWPTYSSYPLFHPYPLFQWYLQSKEIFIKSQYEMLSLSNSAFNTQSSRVIIVLVELGAVKIYVAAVKALGKRKDETQFATKIGGKISLGPCYLVF